MLPIFSPPADGWTKMEKSFLNLWLIYLYNSLSNTEERFILMAKFENGYCEEDIGKMIGISQAAINKKLVKIYKFLKKKL